MSRADIATPASAGALACRGLRTPGRLLDGAGSYMRFYLRAYAQVPRAVIRHRREIWRLLGEVAFGSGALAVIGGTVVTVGFLTSFAGIELGIQGYAQLSDIGVEALTGFRSEEHTSELQSLMRISYAVFCLKKKKQKTD